MGPIRFFLSEVAIFGRILAMTGVASLTTWGASAAAQASAGQASLQNPERSIDQAVGTVKSVGESGITLTSDAGEEVQVTLQESARIVRVAPGQKDLKTATPLQKTDIQVGDRILVRGKQQPGTRLIAAAAVMVMKQGDVAAKQEKDREDWQKRGVGGLVTSIDAGSHTITISMTSFTGSKSVAVHTSKSTILRRYAPNSVKFDDAKIAPIDQIKVGDQLRARGIRNADGGELAADEVVSGTFRNLAGTITAVDAASDTLTLKDVLSKQSVVVKITSDAQLRKLPPEVAQRIAMRLKSGAAAGIPGAPAAGGPAGAAADKAGSGERPPGGGQFPGVPGGMGEGRRGPPDIQQILSRMPASRLTDLQKGDAVMIVSTQGDASGKVNAITLLAGVEPLLTAAPSASQALMLSPWSLSSAGVEAAANP